MSRGPKLKPEEATQAKALKAEGKTYKQIGEILHRSIPTVSKLLKVADIAAAEPQ